MRMKGIEIISKAYDNDEDFCFYAKTKWEAFNFLQQLELLKYEDNKEIIYKWESGENPTQFEELKLDYYPFDGFVFYIQDNILRFGNLTQYLTMKLDYIPDKLLGFDNKMHIVELAIYDLQDPKDILKWIAKERTDFCFLAKGADEQKRFLGHIESIKYPNSFVPFIKFPSGAYPTSHENDISDTVVMYWTESNRLYYANWELWNNMTHEDYNFPDMKLEYVFGRIQELTWLNK